MFHVGTEDEGRSLHIFIVFVFLLQSQHLSTLSSFIEKF